MMRALTCIAIVALSFTEALAAAPQPSWDELDARATSLLESGRLAQALEAARKALEAARQTFAPQDYRVGSSLHRVGILHAGIGELAPAESSLRQALQLRQTTLGPDHPDVASTLLALARVDYHVGNYARARQQAERALAIRTTALGPEHLDVAMALHDLSAIQASLKCLPEAERTGQRALEIRKKLLPPEHPDTAATLANLAEVYRMEGRYGEAEALHQKSLSSREKVAGGAGSAISSSLRKLAALYAAQGRWVEAESLYTNALAIRERVNGPDHPKVAEYLKFLGDLYLSQGKSAQAEPLYRRAATILDKRRAPEFGPLPLTASLTFSFDRIRKAPPVPTTSASRTPEIRRPVPRPVQPVQPPAPATGRYRPSVKVLTHMPDRSGLASVGGGANDLLLLSVNGYPEEWQLENLASSARRIAMLVWAGTSDTSRARALSNLRGDAIVVLGGYPDSVVATNLAAGSPGLRQVCITGSPSYPQDPLFGGPFRYDLVSLGTTWPDSLRVDFTNVLPQRVTLIIGGSYPDAVSVEQVNRLSTRVGLIVNVPTHPDVHSAGLLNRIQRPVRLYIQAPSLTAPADTSGLAALGDHITVLEGQQYTSMSLYYEFLNAYRPR
ncbi:MAG: tetratricopeptide repeat protein [Candidatus Riflebacteria bacterium]|nr:tetratricopeptide repeat protein [Candidatus Riflebacteria bacterium]